MSWTNLKFYAFPPFSCISRCLQKINLEKATGIIMVPRWTTQPFYSVLLRMLVRDPIVIKKNRNNLVMPAQPSMKAKIARKSDLLICLVSGKTYITAGLPEATVQIIMSSWRTSTKNKYNIYLNKWIDYCSTRDIDPFNATIKDGLCFLTYRFECENGYSSINSARSALSAILPTCDGIPFGKQHLVSKFCRGVFQLRPSLPRYAFTWDTGKLLSYYRQIQENSELTLKQPNT